MLVLLLISSAISSAIAAKTYSFCDGLYSFTTPNDDCKTLVANATSQKIDQIMCSPFKHPSTGPIEIFSCPNDIVLNQTDNSAACLNLRCPGKMVPYTYGWQCEDPSCPWRLTMVHGREFDYICEIPDCKGISIKTTTGWICNTTAYDLGRSQGSDYSQKENFLSDHLALVIAVILILILQAVVILILLSKYSKVKTQAKLAQVNALIPRNHISH